MSGTGCQVAVVSVTITLCVIHESDNCIEQNDSRDVKVRQKGIQNQVSHVSAFSDEILPF